MNYADKKYKVWDMANEDPRYRGMLALMRPLEQEYDRVMMTLSQDDRDVITEFVAMCEEMSEYMLEIACQNMDFRKDVCL